MSTRNRCRGSARKPGCRACMLTKTGTPLPVSVMVMPVMPTIGKRMSGSGNYVGLVNNVAELMKLDENQVKESLVPVSE
jgi:hypothetical protein